MHRPTAFRPLTRTLRLHGPAGFFKTRPTSPNPGLASGIGLGRALLIFADDGARPRGLRRMQLDLLVAQT